MAELRAAQAEDVTAITAIDPRSSGRADEATLATLDAIASGVPA
jgi:hypothetical protein